MRLCSFSHVSNPIRLAVEPWIGRVPKLKVKETVEKGQRRAVAPRQEARDTSGDLPEAPEVEQAVLGAILSDPGHGFSAFERIGRKAFFFNPINRELYDRAKAFYDDNGRIDLIGFTAHLGDSGRLQTLGGPAYVTEIFVNRKAHLTEDWLAYYVDELRDRYIRRQIISRSFALAGRAKTDDVDLLLNELSRSLEDLKRAAGSPNGAEQFTIDDLMAFDPAHDPSCLVGNRWQCRGGSSLWCGGAGYGKSSLEIQAAIYWGTGTKLFGIRPVRPLKSLILQAENDIGDTGEQLQGVMAGIQALGDIDMAATKETIVSNVKIYRVIGYAGAKFLDLLLKLIELEKPDLVWIDPLFAFAGCDLLDAEKTGAFLREGIFPIAVQTGVCLQVIHHVGKPVRDKDDRPMSEIDLQYLGFGTSEIQNAFRAVNILLPLSKHPGVFTLTLSKRGERAGARTPDGQFTRSVYMQHAEQGICWMQCDKPEPTGKGREAQYSEKDILAEMSVATGISTSDLQKQMNKEFGMSRPTFFRIWNDLKKTGKIRVDEEGCWTKKLVSQ